MGCAAVGYKPAKDALK